MSHSHERSRYALPVDEPDAPVCWECGDSPAMDPDEENGCCADCAAAEAYDRAYMATHSPEIAMRRAMERIGLEAHLIAAVRGYDDVYDGAPDSTQGHRVALSAAVRAAQWSARAAARAAR